MMAVLQLPQLVVGEESHKSDEAVALTERRLIIERVKTIIQRVETGGDQSDGRSVFSQVLQDKCVASDGACWGSDSKCCSSDQHCTQGANPICQ